MLRLLYLVILLACVLPSFIGVFAVLVASSSFIPALDMLQPSWQGFIDVFAWSGIEESIALSLFSALLSTYLACFITFAILQACWGGRFWQKIQWLLSPLLSFPHVAFAIGFAFLFSPTGFFARLSQMFYLDLATDDALPLLVQDPNAIGLSLMLAIKEVPFLLLMSLSVLEQIRIEQLLKLSASLGYSKTQAWWKVILPQWLPKMRFAIFAVLAYGLSVVDVALIIGPSQPSTLAVLVWQWFNDANLSEFPKAAAGAVLMLLLAFLLLFFARFVEWFLCRYWRCWQVSRTQLWQLPGQYFVTSIAVIFALILPIIILWSLAKRWRFPDLLPSSYSPVFWQQEWTSLFSVVAQSLIIATISASIALILAIVAQEYRLRYRRHLPNYLIAIPMLIPQLCVLLGMQVAILYFASAAFSFWVIWAHVFFIFPYAYLSLDGAWKGFDNRLILTALSLGKSPWQAFIKVKLPLLFPTVIFAWAMGISVSLAQYLPTLILGGGRISTLTTEAVALASGFDLRLTAVYALCQALLPLIFFAFAIFVHHYQQNYSRISLKGSIKDDTYSQEFQH